MTTSVSGGFSVFPRRPAFQPRRRESWGSTLGYCLIVSAVFHAAVLGLSPGLDVELPSAEKADIYTDIPILQMSQLKEIEKPAPRDRQPAGPATVTPPGPPVRARTADLPEISLDRTSVPEVVELTFEEPLAIETAPPAPPKVADEWSEYRPVTVASMRPDIRNRAEVRQFLERRYAPILNTARITGTVALRFWIDEAGMPQRVLLASSSGYSQLDDLALALMNIIRFTPVVEGGQRIRVIVEVPVRFEITGTYRLSAAR